MAQTVEFDLKQTVLQNDTFGPREVRQMQEAIARDFSQYAVLRDAVGELQNREEHTPASHVRLGVCLYLLGRYYRAIEILKQADGGAMTPLLSGEVPFRPAGVPGSPGELQGRREGGLCRRRVRPGPGGGAPLCQRSRRGAANVGFALRRDRADRRVPCPACRHGGRPGRQSAGSRRSVRAGGRDRSQSPRRTVRPGPGERPLRQRRHGDGVVQAGRRPLSHPRRLAGEPRPALRGPRAVRQGRAVLSPRAGRVSRPCPGATVLQGHRVLARAVLRRRRGEETRPDGPGAQRAGDRFRAFGPQPKLLAEDGHHDPRRSLPLHRAGSAGQQELRRDQPGGDQGNARHQGAPAGAIRPGARRRPSCSSPKRSRPTSRRCWAVPSPN